MADLTLPEAWAQWMQGSLDPAAMVLTLELTWWGRIGKVLQFLGALTVIAELVGAQRIRAFGRSLGYAISIDSITDLLREAISFATNTVLYFATNGKRSIDAFGEMGESKLFWPSWVVGPPFGIYFAYFVADHWWSFILLAIGYGLMATMAIGPLVVAVVVICYGVLVATLDLLLIEPIAWVTDRKSIDRLIKLMGIFLIIIGFHFELLAS